MGKIEYKKIYFPDGRVRMEYINITEPVPVEEIHAGLFYEDYGIIRTQTTNSTKHIWLDFVDGEKFQKIVLYRISIVLENDDDIFDDIFGEKRILLIPRSMYKKDKKCVINGKTYIMKNIIDKNYKYSIFNYTSTASNYSCLI